MSQYPLIQTLKDDVGLRTHDFYRCWKCNKLITRERERELFEAMDNEIIAEEDASICSCGSGKYSPALPNEEEWSSPAVVRYTAKMILARGVAAWAEENCPEALPHIEWLLGSGLIEEHYEWAIPIVEAVVKDKKKYTAKRPKREMENE